MSISAIHNPGPTATHVSFSEHEIIVSLSDGRTVSAPLEWFPRLREASSDELASWRLIGGGVGIHWEQLDEDISVAGLLAA